MLCVCSLNRVLQKRVSVYSLCDLMFTSAEQQSGLEQLQHNRLNLESVYNKSYISTRTEELLGPLLELLLDENPLR